ncbi:hypothetical protein ACWGPT_14050 [Pseudorhizobium sp. NPDC055634]
MGKTRAKFTLAACLLLFQSAAKAEVVEVESFGFPYAPGRFERFTDVMSSELGAATTAAIKERYPSIQNIQLFCTGLSGPRLAYIDGVFFALNEKAGRQGAYVTTEAGRADVLDIDKPPSPLAGDFLTILALTRDAGAACQTLFR